tara:strand:+ start:2185 stop:3150 length:966 start_codon:yes stop_codon:yes gene_type:complete
MKKVFITGGAGFVGSRVANQFLGNDYKVYIYDTFKQYLIPDPNKEQPNLLIRLADIFEQIELIQGDTLNKDYLRRTLMKIKPDVIVHMAALPLAVVAIEQTEEAFNSILDSTINILEIIRDFNHDCRLVYTSSSMVYGDFNSDLVSEHSLTNPKDIYGSFKLCGEIIVQGYKQRYKIDTAIVRPSAVYGPNDGNQRVLYKFITRAINGEPIYIDGDGSMKLDFTFVDDAASGFYLVATHENASGEIFNITRGKAESLTEVVQLLKNYFPNLDVIYRDAPGYMPTRGTLDIRKAKEMLGYDPRFNLDEGLKIYIEHLKNSNI